MEQMLLEVGIFVFGLWLLAFSSDKSIDIAARLAATANIPPLLIGIVVLSMGTSLPEISNSVISTLSGHPEMNVGNIFGSALSQITLITGLSVLLGGVMHEGRRDVLLLGGCAIIAAMLALFVVESGDISRLDALFLIISYLILIFISNKYTVKEYAAPEGVEAKKFWPWKDRIIGAGQLLLFMGGVVAGAILVVDSAISISTEVGIPTYLISFFAVAIGTSLPELFVCIAALRKSQAELAIGNILGSNITDTTLALAAGPLLIPSAIPYADIAIGTGQYMVIASILAVALFVWRAKLDKKAAIVLIAMYFASYLFFLGL
jgi:cation:H+ antiporter